MASKLDDKAKQMGNDFGIPTQTAPTPLLRKSKAGRPKGSGKRAGTHRVMGYLTDNQHQKMTVLAEKYNLSNTDLIARAIEEMYERDDNL